MSVKLDIRDLKQLQKKIDAKAKLTDAFMVECISELGARLLAKVIKRTPVGVYPGVVRFVTADGKEVCFNVTPKTGGDLRRGWDVSQPIRDGDMYAITVFNSEDYSQYVEYGHRIVNRKGEVKGWKEGTFMLTESEAELERQLNGIIEKKTAAFLGDL